MFNIRKWFRKSSGKTSGSCDTHPQETLGIHVHKKIWIIESVTVLNVHTGDTYEYITHNGFGLSMVKSSLYSVRQNEDINGYKYYERCFCDLRTMPVIRITNKQVLFIDDVPQCSYGDPHEKTGIEQTEPSLNNERTSEK